MREEVCLEHDLNVVCGANEEELKMIRDFRPLSSWEYMNNMWDGPSKAPVAFTISGMRNAYAKFREIGKEIDEIFPPEKGSKVMDIDFKCKDPIDFCVRYSKLKEARMGEYPSYLMCSNGRSLGKLAAFMANKGSLGSQTLISEEAWTKMHAEESMERHFGLDQRFIFT